MIEKNGNRHRNRNRYRNRWRCSLFARKIFKNIEISEQSENYLERGVRVRGWERALMGLDFCQKQNFIRRKCAEKNCKSCKMNENNSKSIEKVVIEVHLNEKKKNLKNSKKSLVRSEWMRKHFVKIRKQSSKKWCSMKVVLEFELKLRVFWKEKKQILEKYKIIL